MRRVFTVCATAVLACAFTVPVAAGAASGPVTIADQFSTGLQAPRTLNLWASDALVKLKWRNWGARKARATGLISEHAYGKYTYTPSKVVVSRRGMCKGHRAYLRLRYTFHGRWHTADRYDGCRFAGGG